MNAMVQPQKDFSKEAANIEDICRALNGIVENGETLTVEKVWGTLAPLHMQVQEIGSVIDNTSRTTNINEAVSRAVYGVDGDDYTYDAVVRGFTSATPE